MHITIMLNKDVNKVTIQEVLDFLRESNYDNTKLIINQSSAITTSMIDVPNSFYKIFISLDYKVVYLYYLNTRRDFDLPEELVDYIKLKII